MTTLTDIQVAAVRKRFEESAFHRYFVSRVKEDLTLKDCLDKATFCIRGDNGDYITNGLEPAWWAFREAAELCPAFADYCVEWASMQREPIPPRPSFKKKPLTSLMGGWSGANKYATRKQAVPPQPDPHDRGESPGGD